MSVKKMYDYGVARGKENLTKVMWAGFPTLHMMDPAVAYILHDEFFTKATGVWTETTIDDTPDSAEVYAITDEIGGVLLLTTNDTENDGNQIQKIGESFKLAAGKDLWFETRVKVDDATQIDLLVGLALTDATLLAGVDDGVYFRKDDGDVNIDCVTEKDGTETEQDTGIDLADGVYVNLAFFCRGVSQVDFFVNNVKVKSSITNIPDDEELTVSFAVLTGEAAARSLSIDYVRVVQLR